MNQLNEEIQQIKNELDERSLNMTDGSKHITWNYFTTPSVSQYSFFIIISTSGKFEESFGSNERRTFDDGRANWCGKSYITASPAKAINCSSTFTSGQFHINYKIKSVSKDFLKNQISIKFIYFISSDPRAWASTITVIQLIRRRGEENKKDA